MSSYQTISLQLDGPVATIRLNRPEALNALNSVLVRELVQALASLELNEAVRCVVLTGSDKAFCAGADVKEMVNMSAAEIATGDHLRAVWESAAKFQKPLVAALSGYALGGGLELAMCCDIIIASEGTKLGQPEINIGIIPGGGGTQRLSRAVGKYKAMEMVLSGASISAEEAKALGLVNRVVPPGKYLEEAAKLAAEIASKAPMAVRSAKQAILASLEKGLAPGLEHERTLFYELFGTEDKKEGMSAFLEKRKPNFKGR
ncbi:MAG TPA: enoyl-CoA hydratase-related protein [Nitrososphaerales archaeon]|nr:enoyl-CoA hydratase-related protein [Nitrososphaerales archaeon]